MVRKEKTPAFLPYEEAKKVVNALGLKSRDDWKRWSRTERPRHPKRAKFMEKKRRRRFVPYEEAKKVVNALEEEEVRNDRQRRR